MCVCVCVCVREREREGNRERKFPTSILESQETFLSFRSILWCKINGKFGVIQ